MYSCFNYKHNICRKSRYSQSRLSHCTTGAVDQAGDDSAGKYIYMPELSRLNVQEPPTIPKLPDTISVVTTPLQLGGWEAELCNHPDGEYAQFLLDGIRRVSGSGSITCLTPVLLPLET